MQYAFTIQYMIYELYLHQEGVGGGEGGGGGNIEQRREVVI